MPATALTKTPAPGRYSTTGQAVTMATSDAGNGNDFVAAGEMLLIAHNASFADPYNITVTSAASPKSGRTGDVDGVAVAAGEIRVFRLRPQGWADGNGKINVTGQNASLRLGVVQLKKGGG